MFILTLLAAVTIIMLIIAFFILSIGGTIFTIFGADIIVAVGFIWFIFFRKKSNSDEKGSE